MDIPGWPMDNKNIPEEAITPQIAQQVAPDVTPQQVQAKQIGANKIKSVLDQALAMAAKKIGGTFSSRVKDADTMQKKIVQKRLQGRDYNLDDLNDTWGGRLVVDKSDIGKAKSEINDMEKSGLFKIDKQEDVHTGTYHAFHTDIITPDGQKGEIQIMTPQERTESLLNHSIRSVAGEKPDPALKAVVEAQANIAKKLPNPQASQMGDVLEKMMKQNGNNPLNPTITAQVAQQAQQ